MNEQEKTEKLILRLKKIEGQVRGIQKMISDERACREILQQLTAVKSAVIHVSQEYAKQYTIECLEKLDGESTIEREKIAQELVSFLSKSN